MTLSLRLLFDLRFPVMCLLLLWANINSGYWNLREFNTPVQMIHAIRAFTPYVLFPIGLILHRMRPRLGGKLNPVAWLEAYGWIVLFASLLSEHFTAAFYFGVAFMANIYVPQLFLHNWREVRSERVLLYLTWGILALFTLGIAVVARENLFAGYSITGVYKEGVGGMAMSRSSGIARFFGACALLLLCRFWGGKRHYRIIWLAPMLLCASIVWFMQSRGAMLGFAAGALFIFLLGRTSKLMYILIFVIVASIYAGGYDKALFERVEDQVKRGQDEEQFQSMSGRTRSYKIAMRVIGEHPFLGQGNWADRLSGAGHVHNSYLQALMNGGIIGFIPYIISWLVAWRLYFKAFKLQDWMDDEDKQLFMEAGSIMVFFTVRSIPETTTASYSVASLIMVAVFLYIVVLHERLKETVNGA